MQWTETRISILIDYTTMAKDNKSGVGVAGS
jgi:hypothetical protein